MDGEQSSRTTMQRRDIVRPLGHLEKFSSSRHALGLYRGIANACQYVVPSEDLGVMPLRAAVWTALSKTMLRLDSLRLGIVDEDTNQPCFVRVPSVRMGEMLEWITVGKGPGHVDPDYELLRVMERRLDQTWTEMHIRPPWKLIVVEDVSQPGQGVDSTVLEMVFAAHHAITDGKSTAVFHDVLLEELNREWARPEGVMNEELRFYDAPSPVPPQEELVKGKISWSFFLRCLWDEFGPAWLKGPPPAAPWAGAAISLSPHELHLCLVTIPSDAVPSVLAACRSHHTTLTALLHALVLCSVVRQAPKEYAAFKASTAISMQPFAKAADGVDLDFSRSMTDMNTAVSHDFDRQIVALVRSQTIVAELTGRREGNSPLVWQLAEKVRTEIREKVGSLPDDDIASLLAWVGDWRQRWLGKMGKPRDETWSVSNIGSARYGGGGNGKGDGAWQIRRSIFTQPAMIVGPAFGVNVSGVEGGPVTLTLNWQQGIVDGKIVEGVAGDISGWLNRFCQAGGIGVSGL